MITAFELRQEYRNLRLKYNLTIRDVVKLLNIPPSIISKLEVPSEKLEIKLERDTTQKVKAICHECGQSFETYPIQVDGVPVVFPHWICEKCQQHEMDLDFDVVEE